MNKSPLAAILGAINEIKAEAIYGDTDFSLAVHRLRACAIEEFVRHFKQEVPNAREQDLKFVHLLLAELANQGMPDRSLELFRRAALNTLKLTSIQDGSVEEALIAMGLNKPMQESAAAAAGWETDTDIYDSLEVELGA